jgi:hypothetical protein
MEPEGSSPYTQEHTTGPYPEPEESSPDRPIPVKSILISFSHLCLGLPSGLFFRGFHAKIFLAFLIF